MRIVVVGTIVADTIEHADGTITDSLGGIAHTVAALAAMGGDRHRIVPLCRVGEDCGDRLVRWAEPLAGVTLDEVRSCAGPNARVRLSYSGSRAGERIETLRYLPDALGAEEVGAAAGADAVIVNCITGSDCTVEALRRVRSVCSRVYLDVHSLALGMSDDGVRYFRGRRDWGQWLQCADVVQCNLSEAATVCGWEADRVGREQVIGGVQEHMEGAGPAVWLLTLGAEGAVLFQRDRGRIGLHRVAAPRIESVDPTGAGDAFGAGYVCAWLAGEAPEAAARQAVRSGSAACLAAGVPAGAAFRGALRRLESD